MEMRERGAGRMAGGRRWGARGEAPRMPRPPGLGRRVVALFRPYRRQLALIGGAILITSSLGVANPLLIKAIFDQALFPHGLARPNLPLLERLGGLMIAIPILLNGVGIVQTYLANRVGQRVMQDLRDALYGHLQRLALRFFTNTRTGEIQSRLTNDVGGIQSIVTDTASSIVSNAVTVVSTLVAMLILSWELTVLSLCLVPIFLVVTRKVGRKRRAIAAQTQQSKAEMTAITEETLSVSGILLSKLFGRQDDEVRRFHDENQRLAALQVRQQMVGRYFYAGIGTFFAITPALVYLVAGYTLAHGATGISPGTLVAFTTLQARLYYPIGSLLQVGVEIQSSMALFQRIFEYLDLPVEITDAPAARDLALPDVRGAISLRDVSFRYDPVPVTVALPGASVAAHDLDGGAPADGEAARPHRAWAIEHLSLEIEPGQLVAIVGPSGAGKTTISYLLPRLYDVTGGSLAIDGIDVREIRLASLSQVIGMVTQESYLFHASVRQNLLYARPQATQAEIEAATRAAALHDRITDLAEGYDTIVGERGYRLSGGEKQRLAIARVILKDPRILLLDEATSSLDTTSERLVQAALQPLMRGRTTIAIAHRLSTILAADVIFVLDHGRLVERGTHNELLRQGGLYAQLYHQQFNDGLVEARCEDGLVLTSGHVLSTVAAG